MLRNTKPGINQRYIEYGASMRPKRNASEYFLVVMGNENNMNCFNEAEA